VQIGKEGWDCRSLSGVVLSQKGDSPNNMVLQTSCRCLRQVEKGATEDAIIWLNKFNADTLNKQLKVEQNTDIDELNKLGRGLGVSMLERTSRVDYLKLPQIAFYQLRVALSELNIEEDYFTIEKLNYILDILSDKQNYANKNHLKYFSETFTDFKKVGSIQRSNMISDVKELYKTIETEGIENANFNAWLLKISKSSFNQLSYNELIKRYYYKNIQCNNL